MRTWRGRLPAVLAMLLLACSPAAPLIVDDALHGRAIKLVEEKSIGALLLSRDDTLLLVSSVASGHDDGYQVRLFDARSLKVLWSAPATTAGFDPTGRRVLLQLERTIEVRHARSGRTELSLPLKRDRSAAAFLGPRLLAVGVTGAITVLDATDGKTVAPLPVAGRVWGVGASDDGKRVALHLAPPAGREQQAATVQILDYPGFRPRCQAPTGRLTADGRTLAMDTFWGTFLVDADSCAPLIRTCDLKSPSADGKIWVGMDQQDAGRRRLIALHVPAGTWQLGPELVTGSSQLSVGQQQIVVTHSDAKANYIYFRPLRSWTAPASMPDPRKPRPYRSIPCPRQRDGTGDELPGSVSGGTLDDGTASLTLIPGRSDLVLQLSNRGAKPLRIDWERSSLVVAAGSPAGPKRLWLGHLGCDRHLGPDSPCPPTEVLPGGRYVYLLLGKRRPDDPAPLTLAPTCGGSVALELAVAPAAEANRTLRAELRFACRGR